MASIIKGVSEIGGIAHVVDIECHITNGLPSVIIIGFANKAVDEAKERLRASFGASKLIFPKKRITINLAPADIPKDSTGFDLAMAAAILHNSKLVDGSKFTKSLIIGELGLDGDVRAVRGIIGKLISGKQKGYKTFFIPAANLNQAQLVPEISIYPVRSLSDLYSHLTGSDPIKAIKTVSNTGIGGIIAATTVDFIDISGQEQAKRVLELAAAGGHNVLFNGPPGTGKSMLAKSMVGILPPMNIEEVLEVTHMHSLANNDYEQIISQRPFRAPHHSASQISIIGGGTNVKPGEISLSHRGVLFLDELPEYHRSTIESLRQPLEDKVITVSRAKQTAHYPADFILVATSNPCPCGYYGTDKPCSCQPHTLLNYQRKLSGPILDRIDLYVEVDGVNHQDLLKPNSGSESSKSVSKRTLAARLLQQSRYDKATKTNSNLSNRELKKFAKLSIEAEEFLNKAAEQLGISARSYMRTVKVARTIADLENEDRIEVPHITEALQYRRKTPAI